MDSIIDEYRFSFLSLGGLWTTGCSGGGSGSSVCALLLSFAMVGDHPGCDWVIKMA